MRVSVSLPREALEEITTQLEENDVAYVTNEGRALTDLLTAENVKLVFECSDNILGLIVGGLSLWQLRRQRKEAATSATPIPPPPFEIRINGQVVSFESLAANAAAAAKPAGSG